MLKESFHIDGWFPDESPYVSVGEHLMAMSTLRDCLDESLNLKRDVVCLGLFNSHNELVGYVPKEQEKAVRAAMSGLLCVEVTQEYDEDFCYSPIVMATDEDGRSVNEPRKKRWWHR